jgi:hypothetical protein
LRVKHFPAIFLLANTISGFLLGTETAMFLAWLGFFISWTYLRFYRKSPALSAATGGEASATVKGDASDTFAFAEFFPEPLRTPVAAVADRIWDLLIMLKICSPFSAEDIDMSNAEAASRVEGGLPSHHKSGRREEAERRRAVALAALDQRLQAAATRGSVSNGPPSHHVTVPAPSERREMVVPLHNTEADGDESQHSA